MKMIFDRMECGRVEREKDYWVFRTVKLHKTLPYFGNENYFAFAKWVFVNNTVYFYTTDKDYLEDNPSATATAFLDYDSDEFSASDEHPLSAVFNDVLKQVTDGKGKERHGKTEDGRDLTFLDQPLMVITRYVGNGYPLGQAMKKLSEVPAILSQKGKDAAYREILGAIAYAASAALYLQEKSIHD